MALEFKTIQPRNGNDGWEQTTYVNYGGYDYRIDTHKSNNGTIKTTASGGRKTSGGWTFQMFSDPSLTLITEKLRCTINSIQEQHNKAIELFTERVEKQQIPVLKLILTEGNVVSYQDQANPYHEFVVTSEIDVMGDNVCFSLNGTQKSQVSARSILGLGGWKLVENKTIAVEEIQAIKELYYQTEKQNYEKEAIERAEKEATKKANIELGKTLVTIPQDATHIIIATEQQDDSDLQTDYFAYSVAKTVIIGFSKKERNSFSELRDFAQHFEETKFLCDSVDFEKRDGFYLGESKYNGWNVKKIKLPSQEYVFEKAAKGELVLPLPKDKKVIEVEAINVSIELVKYSEKALAVFGQTYEIKDKLRELGGKFSPYLKHKGETAKGWIFPLSKEQDLKALITI